MSRISCFNEVYALLHLALLCTEVYRALRNFSNTTTMTEHLGSSFVFACAGGENDPAKKKKKKKFAGLSPLCSAASTYFVRLFTGA
jgi:hypothetical protein